MVNETPNIKTTRLLLRPFRQSDAPALFRYASDPNVGPSAAWNAHTSVEESREVIRTVFAQPLTWAITLREPLDLNGRTATSDSAVINEENWIIPERVKAGEAIGAIGLSPIDPQDSELAEAGSGESGTDPSKRREIGYWVGRPLWGRGIATEAAHAVIDFGFRTVGLESIWGRHNVTNVASDHVMRACGMRFVRLAKHCWMDLIKEYWDEDVLCLTCGQWEKDNG